MVCDKCAKKLSKVICPDKWKEGARNTTEGGGRKLGENKALTKRFSPYGGGGGAGGKPSGAGGKVVAKCRTCMSPLHQEGVLCHTCAYKGGLCTGCGVKILDVSGYKQSNA